MTRRTFLKFLGGGAVVVGGGGLFYVLHETKAPPPRARLLSRDEAVWVALLLPVAVSVKELERGLTAEQLNFYRTALRHLRSLRPTFPDDPPEEQARFLKSVLESDEFAYQFLRQLSVDASGIRYASPAGWQDVGYPGPPQPLGRPEFRERI